MQTGPTACRSMHDTSSCSSSMRTEEIEEEWDRASAKESWRRGLGRGRGAQGPAALGWGRWVVRSGKKAPDLAMQGRLAFLCLSHPAILCLTLGVRALFSALNPKAKR